MINKLKILLSKDLKEKTYPISIIFKNIPDMKKCIESIKSLGNKEYYIGIDDFTKNKNDITLENFYVTIEMKNISVKDYNFLYSIDDGKNYIDSKKEFPVKITNENNEKIFDIKWRLNIDCSAGSVDRLLSFYYMLAVTGNGGHSYMYVIDNKSNHFGYDGDGNDRILEIYKKEERIYSNKTRSSKDYTEKNYIQQKED
jgi:hypothetical protein